MNNNYNTNSAYSFDDISLSTSTCETIKDESRLNVHHIRGEKTCLRGS